MSAPTLAEALERLEQRAATHDYFARHQGSEPDSLLRDEWRVVLAELERLRAVVAAQREALDAIKLRRCNGCGLPAKGWGPLCSKMNQGDWTHFHSPEWWIARALDAEGVSEPQATEVAIASGHSGALHEGPPSPSSPEASVGTGVASGGSLTSPVDTAPGETL